MEKDYTKRIILHEEELQNKEEILEEGLYRKREGVYKENLVNRIFSQLILNNLG